MDEPFRLGHSNHHHTYTYLRSTAPKRYQNDDLFN